MEGITAVDTRIRQIQSLIGSLAPPPTTSRTQTAETFARTLAQAINAAGSTGLSTVTGSHPSRLGGVAPAGYPAPLIQYGNGKIPTDALTPIGRGNHRLSAPAAAAFRDLEAAARRDGVTFGVTDSYRSYEQQVDLAQRKGLYSEGGLAARPGTSDHGVGLSLDLDLTPKAQAWMRANAGRFGYSEDVPREPWHWTFKPT